MRNTIGANMKQILISHHRQKVWYGDIELIEICAKQCGLIKDHPKKTINCILNGLDKSPYFIKSYIYADFNGCNRKYRCFTLKDNYTSVSIN